MKDDAQNIEDTLLLHDFLPYRLAVLAKAVGGAFSKTYGEKFGISNPQWRVLFALGRRPNCTASYVVEHAALDKVQVSRAVAGLIKLKLVERQSSPGDRRNSLLNMTPKGRRIYDQIVPEALSFEDRLIAGVSPGDLRALDRCLSALMGRTKSL